MGVRVLEDYGEWGTPVMRDAGAGGGLDLRAHRVKKRWAASGGEHKEDTDPTPAQPKEPRVGRIKSWQW